MIIETTPFGGSSQGLLGPNNTIRSIIVWKQFPPVFVSG